MISIEPELQKANFKKARKKILAHYAAREKKSFSFLLDSRSYETYKSQLYLDPPYEDYLRLDNSQFYFYPDGLRTTLIYSIFGAWVIFLSWATDWGIIAMAIVVFAELCLILNFFCILRLRKNWKPTLILSRWGIELVGKPEQTVRWDQVYLTMIEESRNDFFLKLYTRNSPEPLVFGFRNSWKRREQIMTLTEVYKQKFRKAYRKRPSDALQKPY